MDEGKRTSKPRTRLALRISYDGDELIGWQRQPPKRTVQGLLEAALESAGVEGRLQGSARTDAGVHAWEQVAHLDARGDVPPLSELRRRLNEALPPDVRVWSLVEAPRRFNARWAARGKVYRYILATPDDLAAAAEDPFLRSRAWTLPDPRAFPDIETPRRLDEPAMSRALELLLGTRDFAGLATLRGPMSRKRTVRRLGAARLMGADYLGRAGGRIVCVTVAGDAFLKHMVRNLCGMLARVGYGEIEAERVPSLVASRRRHEGPRAPGRGLTLVRVRYPPAVTPKWD